MMKPIRWIILTLWFTTGVSSCADSYEGDEVCDDPVPVILSPSVENRAEAGYVTRVGTQPYSGTKFNINITPVAPSDNAEKYKQYTYQLVATKKTGSSWTLDGTSGIGTSPEPLSGKVPLWAGRTVNTIVNAWSGWISDFSTDDPLNNVFLDQSTEDKMTELDLLHYRETFVPQEKLGIEMEESFEFAFHHHLSQLNVRLVFGPEYDKVTPDVLKGGIKAAGIFNTINSYTFDPDKSMTDAVVAGSRSTAGTFPNQENKDLLEGVEFIKPYTTVLQDENGHHVVSMKALIVPQTLAANTELVIIRMQQLNDTQDGFDVGDASKDAWFIYLLPQEETFESGKAYRLNLQMGTVTTTTRNVKATIKEGGWQ